MFSELTLVCCAQDPDIVRVTVSHLSLEETAPLLRNDAIKMLFVEYRFLGVPLEETETPFSLPKPQPYTQIVYNFTKGKEDIWILSPVCWPSSQRTQSCSQKAKKGTCCCQLKCSHGTQARSKGLQTIWMQICFVVLCELGLCAVSWS